MAEGGYDFENPTFDEGEFDRDVDIDDRLPMVPDEDIRRISMNQSDALADLRGQLRESALENQKQNLVKMFYDEIAKKYKITPERIDYDQFKLSKDGKTLYWEVGDKEIRITAKKGQATFISLGTLAIEYNRVNKGSGGALAIRQYLNLPDYKSKQSMQKEILTASKNVKTAIEEIPLKDFSTKEDVQETVDATGEVETMIDELFGLPEVKNVQSQTDGLNFRELQGLDKSLQRIQGELVNNLAKLTDIDKEIDKQNRKLGEAEDDISKKDITARLKNLEDERAARLEAASENKEALRSQVNRIKETINRVLKEDTTLGERLKTLFREQGITIVSVLTAIGMIIGVIVEAVIPTSGGAEPPPSKPKSQDGVKEWVKKQLAHLGKLLANLAGKAAAALPGIIGSIVSWLLSTTGKVVNWFGNNLWALVVAVAGLLYVAAKEWISK